MILLAKISVTFEVLETFVKNKILLESFLKNIIYFRNLPNLQFNKRARRVKMLFVIEISVRPRFQQTVEDWTKWCLSWCYIGFLVTCLLIRCRWWISGRKGWGLWAVRGLLLIKDVICTFLLGVLVLGWFLLHLHRIFWWVILGLWGWIRR